MGRYKYSVYNTEARMRVGKGRARERGREGKRERDTFKPLSLSLSIPSSHLHPPSRPRSLPSLSSLSPPPPRHTPVSQSLSPPASAACPRSRPPAMSKKTSKHKDKSATHSHMCPHSRIHTPAHRNHSRCLLAVSTWRLPESSLRLITQKAALYYTQSCRLITHIHTCTRAQVHDAHAKISGTPSRRAVETSQVGPGGGGGRPHREVGSGRHGQKRVKLRVENARTRRFPHTSAPTAPARRPILLQQE